MWQTIKKPFIWISDKWNKFQDWVATWAPGLKTKIVAGLGALGSLAAVLQEYISGIPLNRFITETQVTIVTLVLFSLAFWFRMLSNRNQD